MFDENNPTGVLHQAYDLIESLSHPKPKEETKGCIIIPFICLGQKSFLDLIDKNVPILIIFAEVQNLDLQKFRIKELDFIDYRLGLISSGVDQIPDSINTYLNGVCVDINIKDLM